MKDIPAHIGIIVDGNRRWAKKEDLEPFKGHKKGFSLIKDIATWCFESKIKFVTFYIFSTENWKRTKEETEYLIREMIKKNLFEKDLLYFHKRNIKLVVSGRRENLPESLNKTIEKALKLTERNTGGVLNFCLNYGGRVEIVDAVKKIINKNIPEEEICEEIISNNLYHPEIPDPDLIIRTSEKRLSNFLLWQSAYSELYFIDKYWPDITREDINKALDEHQKRKRRYGK
ncbi:di-trans,poly-cis-decaprenylcistransferase [candidate division WOR-3 bacterium]|nr:di-trans,poly-cis-decaprenylcistransferase [candidate division WOR-3 bacterium]